MGANDKTIAGITTSASTLDGTELMHIMQGLNSRKATTGGTGGGLADLFALLAEAFDSVASATTTDLSATSANVLITGTTTITGFGTAAEGVKRYIRFGTTLTLTHNATSLILPGGANITTATKDACIAISLGSGNWAVISYTKADGTPLVGGGSSDGWSIFPVGQIVYVADDITGVEVPPTDQSYRYVKLTAGLTGSGQYNEGCLTSESVSGSAPLVSASASVSLSGSPLSGQTIRLLNTEGRILRPSTSAGTLQNDALQSHTHTFSSYSGTNNSSNVRTQGDAVATTQTTSDHNGRSANETRMKNVGVTAYMRIK